MVPFFVVLQRLLRAFRLSRNPGASGWKADGGCLAGDAAPKEQGRGERKRRRRMICRGVFVVILSVILFALVFLVTGLAGLLLTGNLERAALIGGACG